MLVEAAVIQWASSLLGVEAFSYVPESTPDEFVTVTREGGAAQVGIDRPTVLVKFWAQTDRRAAEMARAAQSDVLAGGLLSHEGVYRVEPAGLSNSPDPDGRARRYQLVLNMVTTSD